MDDYANIHGNTIKPASGAASGGGVSAEYGDITMDGESQITGNTAESTLSAASGGGVYLANSTLTMLREAKIYGNTATTNGGAASGGGVYATTYGEITMESSAQITGNTAESTGGEARGGGAYLVNSSLTMSGNAKIGGALPTGQRYPVYTGELATGNWSTGRTAGGGGVMIDSTSTLTMTGSGEDNPSITGSTVTGTYSGAMSDGGGVYMVNSSTFTMERGTISGNTVIREGGGVYVSTATFRMAGGTISGNSARYGGGIYVVANIAGKFLMAGGEITATNTATNGPALRWNGQAGVARYATISGSVWNEGNYITGNNGAGSATAPSGTLDLSGPVKKTP
jgi:hypothetical protein